MIPEKFPLHERPTLLRRFLHLLSTQVFSSAAVATHGTLVSLTSYFYLCGGLSVIIAALFPGWGPDANLTVFVTIGIVALFAAVLIYNFGDRLPRWFFEMAVMVGTGLVTLVALASGSAAAATCIGYIYLYVIVDSALFFSPRGMLMQYGLVLVSSTLALSHMGVDSGALFVLEVSVAASLLAVAWAVRATNVHERDQLTQLINRRVFEEVLSRALAINEDRYDALSLVLFDIDRFQGINRSRGHHGADELLKRIAATWRLHAPELATLSRLTGDKFALLLPGVETVAAVRYADKFRDLLPAGVTASAGVTLWQSGDTPSRLIGRAESATLEAKSYGRNMTMVFGDEARQTNSIETALQKQEFVMEYQPIFELPERRIVSFEALIRWQHPHRGRVSPVHFIPLAEKTGSIHALGQWALNEVVATIAANSRDGKPFSVAVNASMLELRMPSYAGNVRRTLERHGIAPGLLTIEVTEAVFDGDTPGVLTTIHALKDIGVKIAIDDFGAGYSSLRWLDRFPADILKIDKSFVDTITASDQELKVLSNIVVLGRDLGLIVLAEGVENETQAAVLQRLGVDRIQGYLLGRPMPLEKGRLPGL